VFVAQPDASRVIDVVQLQRELAAGAIRLVDARGADRYAGQNETIDPAAGHVPGAVNHPFARNLDANGQLATVDSLRNLWQTTLAGRSPDAMVAMCGSGVSACLNLLAMEHAGLGGARLYPGSWSEWIRDPARPIAKGETP
jgi:thiosulfate/3-mercaptopyruvate sulfurtransferase